MKKKLLSVSLVLILLCVGFFYKMAGFAGKNSQCTERYFEPIEMMTTGEYTYFRSKPSESSSVERISPPGEKVVVCGIASEFGNTQSIYYIVEGEKTSYVKVQFLTQVETDAWELPVDTILQNPELPNGCEVTSLAIVLNYDGIPVSKTTLAKEYLPKSSSFSSDPNKVYIGDPFSDGQYCFCGALSACVDALNKAQKYNLTSKDLTGESVSSVYREVKSGHPVIVFATIDWEEPQIGSDKHYYNLHCVVISGYTQKTVTIIDPLLGKTTVSRFLFEDVWYKMGQRAMVVY